VASEVGVPSTLLYAVALAESGRVVGGLRTARPWPWTLNLAGQGRAVRHPPTARPLSASATAERSVAGTPISLATR
jgi:hypothetical protein